MIKLGIVYLNLKQTEMAVEIFILILRFDKRYEKVKVELDKIMIVYRREKKLVL
jgi:hypothetical protein